MGVVMWDDLVDIFDDLIDQKFQFCESLLGLFAE
jgi:hypothetical protein